MVANLEMSGSESTRSQGGTVGGLGALRGFRPDVQALRGLAVLLVVFYHAKFVFPGGFVGVDVFFVISGFVIGRQLFGEFTQNNRLSFGSFYARRARRILPPLAVMLTVVVLLSPLLAPISSVDTSKTGIAAALFSANAFLYKATADGYFAVSAELNPLLHTWSLSVEEQFYFAIPALLALAWRLGARKKKSLRASRAFVALLIFLSFALCVMFSEATTIGPLSGLRFAFFSPFTRAWEFGFGLALVLLPARLLTSRTVGRVMTIIGLGAIGFAAVAYSDLTRFPGWAALVPVLGAALVIAGGTATGSGASPPHPRLRPMIAAGNISYSWYLWHWPLIVFAAAYWPLAGNTPLIAAAIVSLVPAWISYNYLEQRIRSKPSARAIGVLALAAVCIVLPIAATALAKPVQATIDSNMSFGPLRSMRKMPAAFAADCASGDRAQSKERCTWNSGEGNPSVVLVGDSNADHFSETMIGAARANGASLEIWYRPGCPFADLTSMARDPYWTQCYESVSSVVESLVENPPDVVAIANATDIYISGSTIPNMPQIDLVNEAGERISSEVEAAAEYSRLLSQTVTTLQNAGIHVIIINVVPKPYFGFVSECSFLGVKHSPKCGFDNTGMTGPGITAVATDVEAGIAAATGAEFWSFNSEICPDNTCVGIRDGAYVWRDYAHISVSTAESLVDSAAERLRQSLAQ